MKRTFLLPVLGAGSLLLSGCQTFLGPSAFAGGSRPVDTEPLDMTDYFASRLEMGRAHLAHGRPTQAITAFRQASYDPKFAGPASNGMGVAYAQIGRQDLARRYFTLAVAANPQDERFARNLARLEQAPEDTRQTELARIVPPPSQGPVAENAASGLQGPRAAAVRRISAREIQILSSAETRTDKAIVTDPEASGGARTVAVGGGVPTRPYPVRIELPRAARRTSADYPVRIALADVKITQPSSYPVRIKLPRAQ